MKWRVYSKLRQTIFSRWINKRVNIASICTMLTDSSFLVNKKCYRLTVYLLELRNRLALIFCRIYNVNMLFSICAFNFSVNKLFKTKMTVNICDRKAKKSLLNYLFYIIFWLKLINCRRKYLLLITHTKIRYVLYLNYLKYAFDYFLYILT